MPPTRASSLGDALGTRDCAFRAEWRAVRPRIVLGELLFADALADISKTLSGRVDAAAIERIRLQRIREKTALYDRGNDDVLMLSRICGATASASLS